MLPVDSLPILLFRAEIQFQPTSTGAIAYNGDFRFGGNLSAEKDPLYSCLETGIFAVTLTAFNPYLVCPTEVSRTFTNIPDEALYFPNAFTPNDDGQNDMYRMGGGGVLGGGMIIFNRWGREITRLGSLDTRWGRVPTLSAGC